jgi:glutamate-1-semialdehyde 2,1-aminomutase
MTKTERYSSRFEKSRTLYEKSKELFPNGICHDIRRYEPFPFVAEKAEGPYIFTIDKIKLLDLWCGHYGNILGHRNKATNEALIEATEIGTHFGTLNLKQMKLAELIKTAIPQIELMRFCSSGTESTMYACRVAKAFTGRELIVKIEGGWHGGSNELSNDAKPPFNSNSSLSLPFNDSETTSNILKKIGSNAAAIIIEPVLGAGGGIVADTEYLQLLRKFCDETGTLLIFDEVVTGFRFRFGSIAPLLGVMPDLFTLGKIVGGGLSIGAYGGRADIMSTITDKKVIVGGGTFSANPVAMCAGYNTLITLQGSDYSLINNLGHNIREGLQRIVSRVTDKAVVTGMGSFFFLHLLNKKLESNYINPSILLPIVDTESEKLFKLSMLLHDVYTMHSGGALSFAHLDISGIENTILSAYSESLEELSNERRQLFTP